MCETMINIDHFHLRLCLQGFQISERMVNHGNGSEQMETETQGSLALIYNANFKKSKVFALQY